MYYIVNICQIQKASSFTPVALTGTPVLLGPQMQWFLAVETKHAPPATLGTCSAGSF